MSEQEPRGTIANEAGDNISVISNTSDTFDSGINTDAEKMRKPNPLFGFGAYIVAMLMLIFAAAPIQLALGLPGVAITELLILCIALLTALLSRQNLRDVFPVRIPKGREAAGTALVWSGFWGITVFVTFVIMYFFPDAMQATGTGLTDVFTSMPFAIMFTIIAVSPAICEEALFRGLIQHSFSGFNKWIQVTLVAVLFGIMHLDPVRIIPTGILGFGLGYVMMKTNNLALSGLFHLINNGLSAVSTAFLEAYGNLVPAEADAASVFTGDMVFIALFFVIGAPAAIVAGGILLEPRRPSVRGRFRDKRKQIIAACTVSVLALSGFIYAIASIAATGIY